MKKSNSLTILTFAGVLIITALFFYNRFEKTAKTQGEEAGVSGAYQALLFNGDRQAYPDKNMPENAYYAAWAKMQSATSASTRTVTTDPWETMGPHNRGGRTLALAFNPQNPNTMYAGSASGGLWRTYSAGMGVTAWEQLDLGQPILGVSSITFAPGDSMTMYIGTGEVYNYNAAGTGAAYRNTRGSWGMGILKSTDGGQNWTKSLDWSYNQNHGIWAIKIPPSDPNIVFAATTEGVYKSTDAGTTWNQMLNVPMATDILVKSDDPNMVVVVCGNFQSPGFGIYRSTDGGGNWTKIENNLPNNYNGKGQLAMAPSNEDIIYASIGNGFGFSDGATWLCRSTDFGATWEIRNTTDYSKWQGWFSHDVAVDPNDPDYLVAIGIEIWVSEDGGNNIVQETIGGIGFPNPPIEGPDGGENFVHSDAHDVVFHPTEANVVYVASDGGMHRSEDGGLTWRSANGSYQTAQFYNGASVSPVDEDFFIGGLQDNGTIKWNGDLTWTLKNGGDGSWTAASVDNPNAYFVSSQNLNVRRTFDDQNFSGIPIATVNNAPAFIAPYVLAPSNGDVLYSGSASVGKSIDFGSSWNLQALNIDNGNPILSMEVAPENEDVLYLATAPLNGNRGHVFVTVDGGDNFTDITQDLPDRFPMDMTVDPTDEATAYITYSGFGTGHVFKTQDYGASWQDITGTLPDIPTNAVIVDPLLPNHIYIGNDFGVFASTDGGATWEAYQEGLPDAIMVFDLKISPINRKLRIASHGNGAYQRDLLEEPLSNENIVQDIKVKLFPNPSSGAFSLDFENRENQKVLIEILDINGRQIRTLSNENLGIGKQRINADISNLTKGIYYIRLSSDSFTRMQQLILQ